MKKIVMDIREDKSAIALLQGGKLVEVLYDNMNKSSKVGNIYNGHVTEVSKNFIFLNIGEEKVFLNNFDGQRIKVGDKILVQVRKDKIEDKLAAVSTELNFVSRYLVLSYNSKRPGGFISSKINQTNDISWLKTWATTSCPHGFSLIVRTDAACADKQTLDLELESLKQIAKDALEAMSYTENKTAYYEASLKSLLSDDITVVVNNKDEMMDIKTISEGYNIEIAFEDGDIFKEYEIDTQLKALENNKVWLKTGGYIVIDKTTALTVIDVNSAKAGHTKKDIIYQVNKEAALEVARQLRLRNISGIIIVDFINMDTRNEELLTYFRSELKKDRINVNLVGMTALGLCELTRKRGR